MRIGDFVTLEGFQEEMLGWLEDVKEKCVPSGCWWDKQKMNLVLLGYSLKFFMTREFTIGCFPMLVFIH